MRFLADFKLPRSGHFFAAQSEKKRRMLGPDGHEIASWSKAGRISCIRALPPPCAKPAANKKAADMDANEFVTHGTADVASV